MNILDISDIQDYNNRIYLNNPERKDGKSGTKLFYTSNDYKQHYFIIRGFEVIASGVMNGYVNGENYSYRFDFENFIKITNQEEPVYSSLDSYGSYKFTGNNAIDLYMYIGKRDILQENIDEGILNVGYNGNITLNTNWYTYLSVKRDNQCFVSFIDGRAESYDVDDRELQYRNETVTVAQKGSYMPITVYRNNAFMYTFVNRNGETIYQSPLLQKGSDDNVIGLRDGYIMTQSDGYAMTEGWNKIMTENTRGMNDMLSARNGYITYMLKIPNNAEFVSYAIYSNSGKDNIQSPLFESRYPLASTTPRDNIAVYGFRTVEGCMTPYYFWNDNGGFDTIYCSGTRNELVDVEKKYVEINGVKTPIKITTSTRIKHNTGLAIKQEQMYSLIKAPNVNAITPTANGIRNEMLIIDNESFEGFNGLNLSERNVELIFSYPKDARRITNKEISFFD